MLGQIAGAVIGGGLGQIIGTGAQIGFGAGALKYSRKYETQSDILGAQIMARAGYDPRDLANMFRTIEQQSGGRGGGPEWMSSHPNPGNRYQRINQEAALLRVSPGAERNSAQFARAQSSLRGMPRARSMEEIAQSGQRKSATGRRRRQSLPAAGVRRSRRVSLDTLSHLQRGNLFRVSVPDNWREFAGGDGYSVTYAPEGAYNQNTDGSVSRTA